MADITPTKSLDIQEQLKNLELLKYHPSGIFQLSLNRVADMLDGKVTQTDPSNPFIYLLETSSLNTAFAIQEYTLQTRKRYPRLANTQEDLYLHMSDYDFLGRFSQPSSANVLFNILFNDFKTKAAYNPVQKEHVLKIPRHTKVKIGQYVYMLTSAIIIRQTENNVIDVKFEDQDFDNLFPVTTNYINFALNKSNQEETYLSFMLKLPEVDIDVLDVPADLTSACKGTLPFNPDRKFYYIRVFHFQDDQWKELLVTHTNDVYDILTPTCIVKVLQDEKMVNYHIPAVYITQGKVSTNLKFLIYTTMGKISVNFGDYQLTEFSTEYAGAFPDQELDEYTQPVESITKLIYTTDIVSSGEDGMTFAELKDAVIDNSIGDRKLPITAKQLSFSTDRTNFKLIKDVDVVTNRVYKLETEIPAPLTRYPITKFNLDIIEMATTVRDLRRTNGVFSYADDITVIPEGTLFRLDNGKLTGLLDNEVLQLKELSGIELVNALNNDLYLVTYYHYVLDTSRDQASLKAYDLTTPSLKQINFQKFNPTARIGINSTNANLYRTSTGYAMDVLANTKQYISGITYSNVSVYMVYIDNYDSKFYLPGSFLVEANNSPVYRFAMASEQYIDADNKLTLTGFLDSNGLPINIAVPLNAEFQLLYTSNIIPPAFQMTDMDSYITGSYLSGLQCAVTLENVS
nr:hypothetical protein [Candidatus Nanopelagicales bacterium]